LILLHQKGLAQSYMLQGRLKSAGKILEEALIVIKNSTGTHGQLPTAAAFVYLEYGNYLRELNQLKEAFGYVGRGLELGIARRIDGASLQEGFMYMARIKYDLYDHTACLKVFQDADKHLIQYDEIRGFRDLRKTLQNTLTLTDLMANLDSVSIEDKRALEDWIIGQDLTSRPEVNSNRDELRFILWVRWYLLKHQYQEALVLLDHLFIQADHFGRRERIITIRILQAIAFEAVGELPKALQIICRAIRMAEPEGYFRIFVNEGMAVKGLLEKLASGQVRDDKGDIMTAPIAYLKKLILFFEVDRRPASITDLPESMTNREQDVLLMLSKEFSNNEIAKKLFISIDTVKSHLKNINVKLNTGNRKQAVERARELGLL